MLLNFKPPSSIYFGEKLHFAFSINNTVWNRGRRIENRIVINVFLILSILKRGQAEEISIRNKLCGATIPMRTTN
jgi:hypothetical protein